MDDPEDEHDPILGQDVVHDSVVADAESMKRVIGTVDRLDRLALQASATGDVPGQGLERFPQPSPNLGRELLVGPGRRGPKRDSKRGQASSDRSTVLPSA